MTVETDEDNYNLIQLVKHTMCISEPKAVNLLIEIGLENILAYPSVPKRVFDILSQPKFQMLITRIKQVWVR